MDRKNTRSRYTKRLDFSFRLCFYTRGSRNSPTQLNEGRSMGERHPSSEEQKPLNIITRKTAALIGGLLIAASSHLNKGPQADLTESIRQKQPEQAAPPTADYDQELAGL